MCCNVVCGRVIVPPGGRPQAPVPIAAATSLRTAPAGRPPKGLERGVAAQVAHTVMKPDINIDPKTLQRFENFGIIEPIRYLGIFCWDPTGLRHKKFRDVTAQDVQRGLRQQDSQPYELVPLNSIDLPLELPRLPPQVVDNVFPHDSGFVVPLYVARARGVDLGSVDFILGGSALNVLANKQIERQGDTDLKYLVQKCPATGIIVLAKSKTYSTDYAATGFQFERLLTGRPLDDEPDLRHFESLQLIRVAGYTVLFAAEVDAVDSSGTPVELRSSRSSYRYRVMKNMFQMLSSGSETLIQAARNGPVLEDLVASSFDDLVWGQSASYLASAGSNIAEALRMLKRSDISVDAPTELDFQRGTMVLKPCPVADLLPSASVLRELFSSMSTAGESEPQHLPREQARGESEPQPLPREQALEALRRRMELIVGSERKREAAAAALPKRQITAAKADTGATGITALAMLGFCVGSGGIVTFALFRPRRRRRSSIPGGFLGVGEEPFLAA